ncbi:DNA topoisomerase-1 [Sporobacter termitidis DSM 10068]|uniref:DNA topoisomerase 1 n=1 Tax=Sporobacter termitidis DSM 10068 TaxID=1123282 RepID=A0A1M5UKZ3_9FIRM|nr:type I DNA topoisomerase [Sporobacter termitidis]SHH63705.1 DNA topoisomerase-1 [Sporobacter termitidis DSM 10068]
MAKAKTNLVIVESPAKAKTIGKYLGSDYKVTASMGHLRDLPKSTLGVDIEHGFLPNYQPVKGREETISELKSAAKNSARVYLATDPDREGEAISWHLKELLGLKDEEAYRVTFNEITKKVVRDSIESPRAIDKDLVDAQQARRVLDRIVGYKLSPFLWRKIKRGLSAGRVQSVATRMVTDREDEIRAFVPEEYWLLDVDLSRTVKQGRFKAGFHGREDKKMELTSEDEVKKVVAAVENSPFTVGNVKRSEKRKSPSPPFITSTLQQEASRKLGMTPRRTMSIAQQLYEGIDIEGEGTVGLITYMRTDSLRISEEALSDAKTLITNQYGPSYYPGSPTRYKTKNTAQDAHEAIRPSNVFITPDKIKNSVTSDQYKLYRLIWSRFISCQMTSAVYDSVTVDVVSAGYVFRATNSVVKFSGFTAVYEEGRDDDREENNSPLPDLEEGEPLKLEDIKKEQKFTSPPSRYTEATLIKAMEETGVGRPSTYAPTISTILDREYVVKDGRNLRPTALGEVVTGLMKDRFSDIVDLKFTARMEESLDSIEKGVRDWQSVLADFYGGFAASIDSAETALEGERIKIPDELSDEICDRCGRQMVVKAGRFGRFLACPGYPECNFTKPLVVEMPGRCPKCGSRILKRTSKNGYTYYACEKLKECGFMTWDVPVKENCPECGQTLFKKSGRGFKKPFCINEACPNFLPEDKRGYKKKTETGETAEAPASEDKKQPAKPAGKAAAKPAGKTAGKKAPAKEKKTAKKTAAKPKSAPAAGKKSAGKKTPAAGKDI